MEDITHFSHFAVDQIRFNVSYGSLDKEWDAITRVCSGLQGCAVLTTHSKEEN